MCTACPQVFCHTCFKRIRHAEGAQAFSGGCVVCKYLCCCANKTHECARSVHCYKKCPVSRAAKEQAYRYVKVKPVPQPKYRQQSQQQQQQQQEQHQQHHHYAIHNPGVLASPRSEPEVALPYSPEQPYVPPPKQSRTTLHAFSKGRGGKQVSLPKPPPLQSPRAPAAAAAPRPPSVPWVWMASKPTYSTKRAIGFIAAPVKITSSRPNLASASAASRSSQSSPSLTSSATSNAAAMAKAKSVKRGRSPT